MLDFLSGAEDHKQACIPDSYRIIKLHGHQPPSQKVSSSSTRGFPSRLNVLVAGEPRPITLLGYFDKKVQICMHCPLGSWCPSPDPFLEVDPPHADVSLDRTDTASGKKTSLPLEFIPWPIFTSHSRVRNGSWRRSRGGIVGLRN